LTAPDQGNLDPAIIASLYVDHGDELRRFLYGVLRDSALVGDALQAAFTKAIESGHDSNEQSRKAWLFRVAYNEAMALRRRQGVNHRAVQKLAEAFGKDQGCRSPLSDAEESLIRLETIDRVRQAIRLLSAEQAEVVRLRVYEEKKFAEIAEELGIPLGTALGRMRTALAKLRTYLEPGEE